jgi:hypothetical protein
MLEPSTSSVVSFAARRDVPISNNPRAVFSYVSFVLFVPCNSLTYPPIQFSTSGNTVISPLPPRLHCSYRLHPSSHPSSYHRLVHPCREVPSTACSVRPARRIHIPCDTCSRLYRFDIVPCSDHVLEPHSHRNPRKRGRECSSITWVQGSLLIHPAPPIRLDFGKTLPPSPHPVCRVALFLRVYKTAEPRLASTHPYKLKMSLIHFASRRMLASHLCFFAVFVFRRFVLQHRVCFAHFDYVG